MARSCCRSALCSRRSRPRGDDARRNRQATTAILESGAIMLGAALVFVTLFRQLKLGATLGYIVAGALIGPAGARPDQATRSRSPASPRSASRCCCSSSGSSFSRAGCGGCARTFSGSACRRSCCAAWRSARLLYLALGISPEAALAIGLPLACRRPRRCCRCCAPTTSSTRRRASAPFRSCCSRTSSIVPMITIIAAMARAPPDPSGADRLEARALHRARGGRAGDRRPAGAQPAVPAGRPARRARAVHRRRPVHRDRRRGGDAYACTCRSRSAPSSPA